MSSQKQKNKKLPNLFVGPLGEAQLNAARFAEGISKVDGMMAIIEKIEKINKMIEDSDMSKTELQLAEKLLNELTHCFITLSGETYGTGIKKEVY